MAKLDSLGKLLDDEKQKNAMIQNKLDKKVKELQDMNEYTKKLLANKENLLSQYEDKIDEINNDKNNLIAQNKQLLEKLKSKSEEIVNNSNSNNLSRGPSSTNLADIINEEEENSKEELHHYMQENKLLKEEIKGLKEQIATQAQDLVDLNSLEREAEKLRAQNEVLTKDNKELKKELDKKKKDEDLTYSQPRKRQFTVVSRKNNNNNRYGRRGSNSENLMDKTNFEKQLYALKMIKEEEKKDYEKQIDKIRMELAMLKVKNSNHQFETDTLLIKYKNTIKSIATQCKKKGIKLSLNLITIK